MGVKKTFGKIIEIVDLSKTAKEIKVKLEEPINFIAGSFINIFLDIDGEKVRRAYSISSSDQEQNIISFSMRLIPKGRITSVFWNRNMLDERIEIMGPLGLNTAEKMNNKKIYLFAFGIGAGVVKSLANHFYNKDKTEDLMIMTGSRFEDEIIHKKYFDNLARTNKKVKVSHIVSRTQEGSLFKKGYVQDYVNDLSFDDSDVYVCGQKSACNDLIQKIREKKPVNCNFFIEGFN
ncbi:MAG: FAD-binding oxidoreductase [Candidatus Paceibacterota bacterium]|jgi:NAD(P)H-flavin reductase